MVSTHLKNMLVKLDHFPRIGVNIKKCLSCHHPVFILFHILIDHLYIPTCLTSAKPWLLEKWQDFFEAPKSFGKATVLDHSGINLSVFQLVSKRCATFSSAKWRKGWNLPKNHRVNHPYYAAFSVFEGFGCSGWIDLWELGTYEENTFNLTQKVILILDLLFINCSLKMWQCDSKHVPIFRWCTGDEFHGRTSKEWP